MEHLDSTFWTIMGGIAVAVIVWEVLFSDTSKSDGTSSNDGWFSGDGDGDGD